MKRKRYSEEQIISILKEQEPGKPVSELALRHGVVENTIYRRKPKYGGMKFCEAKRLRKLEQENARLARLSGPATARQGSRVHRHGTRLVGRSQGR